MFVGIYFMYSEGILSITVLSASELTVIVTKTD